LADEVIDPAVSTFLPDTNIWKHIGKDEVLTPKFERALAVGDKFLIAPPSLIELIRGLVRGGQDVFSRDQKMLAWMRDKKCEILELTLPFMACVLHANLPASSGVVPAHYAQLIETAATSKTFDEFVERCNADGSVWKQIESLDQIHDAQIEKELKALEDLAKNGKALNVPARLASKFGAPGCRPSPLVIGRRFSAAIEYLETSIRKVAQGSNPRKNDRGVYVDWQLLMYLATPDVKFLTNEDFSAEISKSPQKDRIVKPDVLV
jgi:hypothetical protein